MKLLFFKLAAISAGIAFALAAILGGIYWYLTRPVPEKPWNETAFIANGPPSFDQTDDGYVILTYDVKNLTERDFSETSYYSYKLLVVRPDKSLTNPIETEKGTAVIETPIFIPAHQTGTLRLKLHVSIQREAGISNEDFHEELRAYMTKILYGGEYFVVFDEARHCRINLPAVAPTKPSKS
jgi:hypothetical protein